MIRAGVVVVAALASACTFEDGHGFATIDSAQLSGRFEPGVARDLNGAVLTDQGYQVRLNALELTVDSAELLELRTQGSTGQTFDPANPPPGYSLCHGGHCHADDGRLVPYSDIEAELAGGGSAALHSVATLKLDRKLDLLLGATERIDSITPSRELPESRLRKVSVKPTHLTATGTVSGATLAENAVNLAIDLQALPTFAIDTDVDISRDGPAELDIVLAFKVDGTLLDSIDFAALANNGNVSISEPDSAAARSISAALGKTTLTFSY